MKCFAFAMEKEAKPLLDLVKVTSVKNLGFAKVYEAEHAGKKFIFGSFGIGKCFAASFAAAVSVAYPEVDEIINVGAGGSLDPKKAPLLSAVLGESFVEHDLDTSPIGDPVAMVSGINVINFKPSKKLNDSLEKACKSLNIPVAFGVMSSGDQFVADKKKIEEITKTFGSLSVDMESAAMAQIAYVFKKEYAALRLVSDTGNAGEYEQYVHQAAASAAKVVVALLEQ